MNLQNLNNEYRNWIFEQTNSISVYNNFLPRMVLQKVELILRKYFYTGLIDLQLVKACLMNLPSLYTVLNQPRTCWSLLRINSFDLKRYVVGRRREENREWYSSSATSSLLFSQSFLNCKSYTLFLNLVNIRMNIQLLTPSSLKNQIQKIVRYFPRLGDVKRFKALPKFTIITNTLHSH